MKVLVILALLCAIALSANVTPDVNRFEKNFLCQKEDPHPSTDLEIGGLVQKAQAEGKALKMFFKARRPVEFKITLCSEVLLETYSPLQFEILYLTDSWLAHLRKISEACDDQKHPFAFEITSSEVSGVCESQVVWTIVETPLREMPTEVDLKKYDIFRPLRVKQTKYDTSIQKIVVDPHSAHVIRYDGHEKQLEMSNSLSAPAFLHIAKCHLESPPIPLENSSLHVFEPSEIALLTRFFELQCFSNMKQYDMELLLRSDDTVVGNYQFRLSAVTKPTTPPTTTTTPSTTTPSTTTTTTTTSTTTTTTEIPKTTESPQNLHLFHVPTILTCSAVFTLIGVIFLMAFFCVRKMCGEREEMAEPIIRMSDLTNHDV